MSGKRVLLFAATTGYQTRAFGEAAGRLGVELVFATDRCSVLDDPWQDQAIPIRFQDEDTSTAAIVDLAAGGRFAGVLAVGDRPTMIAARAAAALGLRWHPVGAAAAARHKRLTRERLREAGLPVPWFTEQPLDLDPAAIAATMPFPCVVKPLALSGSRGVIRANDAKELEAALERLRALLAHPAIRAERDPAHERLLIEGFIAGREYAVEGLMTEGELQVLAIFDKPDPLDGPFFEETLYITPSRAAQGLQDALAAAVSLAAQAIGLYHGPIHAECRAAAEGVHVLEVAARPIGGLCSRTLRFVSRREPELDSIGLEDLLIRQAIGDSPAAWTREDGASGVLMIPIPKRGTFRRATGIEEARATPLVGDVVITAKADQLLVPLPEGASYLGFVFARGDSPAAVEEALRTAHARLSFTIDPEMRVLQSAHG